MKTGNSMVWVFSFADLAFLLVMVLAIMPKADMDYSSLKLSKVSQTSANGTIQPRTVPYRIYVSRGNSTLSAIHIQKDKNGSWENMGPYRKLSDLKQELIYLKEEKAGFSFLADKESKTGALLQALALIHEVWPNMDVHTTVKRESDD